MHASDADISGKITATSGSIAGNLVSSGINASNITSGTLDIRNGNAYLKMGFGTSHPEASGFNITGSHGIKLNGNGISECSGLAVTTVTTYNTNAVDFNAGLNVTGPLYAGAVSDFYKGVNSTTLYVKRTDAAGNDNGYYTIQINRGIIHNVVAHDP